MRSDALARLFEHRRTTISILVLLLAAALPYLFGLHHEFVGTDYDQIVENPDLRNPSRILDVLALETLSDHRIHQLLRRQVSE